MSDAVSADLLSQLSPFIASRMGLHFPKERWGDLATSLTAAAREQGLRNAEAYVRWLLSSPVTRHEIETLASHLTVGETYFFREKGSFEALREQVLPELIGRRREDEVRLRIWSAGCCTGEEPYSLAMLLDGLIPDISDWNITVLATDINSQFLEIASAGVYREWSFRAIPPGIRERYFSPMPGGKMQLAQRIRRMVTFSFLNLAEDAYPSPLNNTNAMDVVLCRNVLMYFTPEHAARVATNLYGTLVQDGWLLVAPSEASQVLFKQFTAVDFPDSTFYRKTPVSAPPLVSVDEESQLHHKAVVVQEVPSLGEREDASPSSTVQTVSLIDTARALANRGELAEALSWCDRAIASDALNPAFRFLRAMVAQELGRLDDAAKSLQQALYLDADFIMAHFGLSTLSSKLGRHQQSQRHLRSALVLLERLEPDAPLPEAEGLTAERLIELIHSTIGGEDGES
jgi:chemotaxis protein methyltransferase CheR